MATLRSTYSLFLELLRDPKTCWLVLLFLGYITYLGVSTTQRSTETAVVSRYNEWWGYLHRQQFSRAYAMMSPSYRAEYTENQFTREFIEAGEEWLRPHSGRKVANFELRATIFPRDSFSDGNGGPEYELIQVNNQWYFTGSSRFIYGKRSQLFAGN